MKRRILVSGLLALILVFMCAAAAWAERLAEDKILSIEKYLKTHMERFGVPGMSMVIVADGEVVYANGFGVLKAGKPERVDAYTDFQIASVSKNFTALAITQLQDQGRLSVNDPVTKYLPWFATKDAERSQKITIKNLLQHTSGIPTTAYGLEIQNGTMEQLEDQVKRAANIALTAEPGATHQYSNLNYWTLALIVEKVSGMKFADYMRANIFEPLEMTRTGYIDTVEKLDNVAAGHRYEGGKSVFFDYTLPGTTIAAGGIYTNARDMGNYIIALLNSGTYKERTILTPESWQEMVTNGTSIWDHIQYGYGLMIWQDELGKFIQHGGDNPNYTADLYLIPDKNIGFAVMSNSQHSITHGISRGIKDIIFGAEPLDITTTGVEAGEANMTRMIAYGQYLLLVIMAVWLVVFVLGLRKGKYSIFKKAPTKLRLLFQVIILPVICIAAAYFLYQLPVGMIGSLHVALLYKPDLVGTVLKLAVTLIIFAAFMGLMGFVKKTGSTNKTKSA